MVRVALVLLMAGCSVDQTAVAVPPVAPPKSTNPAANEIGDADATAVNAGQGAAAIGKAVARLDARLSALDESVKVQQSGQGNTTRITDTDRTLVICAAIVIAIALVVASRWGRRQNDLTGGIVHDLGTAINDNTHATGALSVAVQRLTGAVETLPCRHRPDDGASVEAPLRPNVGPSSGAFHPVGNGRV
jgi:hypothetical protein